MFSPGIFLHTCIPLAGKTVLVVAAHNRNREIVLENMFCLRCNRELGIGHKSVAIYLFAHRGALETFETTQEQLVVRLQKEPLLAQRVLLLKSIRGVGPVTSLTWILEIGRASCRERV